MKCEKCKQDFPESEIQLSHDIPRYAGGTDSDGRHWLCKKCHDIYERRVASIIWQFVSRTSEQDCHDAIKQFNKRWINDTKTT